jgi:chromosome segregation ATPase
MPDSPVLREQLAGFQRARQGLRDDIERTRRLIDRKVGEVRDLGQRASRVQEAVFDTQHRLQNLERNLADLGRQRAEAMLAVHELRRHGRVVEAQIRTNDSAITRVEQELAAPPLPAGP